MRAQWKKYSVLRFGWAFFLITLATSWVSAQSVRQCGTVSSRLISHPLDETGGIHITAQGTLRVLIVFASFPDDETPNPYWPPHAPPQDMQKFIDPDTVTQSQEAFNLTNYFNQMSLGQFHLVGEALWVETSDLMSNFRGSFGNANRNVLQGKVDSLVDFTQYDNWTNSGDYLNINAPDGRVDMIIMVWRMNPVEFVGEASLGYKSGFLADGKRIEMGFPDNLASPLGSGVTCEFLYNDSPVRVMRTMIHEVGHWLLGGAHPYNGSTLSGKHHYWGMICSGQRTSSCANAYERERLGWIRVPDMPADSNISFPDYVQTGTAYKFHPANGEGSEYFYFENHQNLSAFDDVTANPDDRGVWILHQEGPYMEMDNLRIRPSDGVWVWTNPGVTSACFSQPLPIFSRGGPALVTGESHRDQIPTATSLVNWMFAFQDPSGQLNCGSFFAGQSFIGAFNVASNPVFSPYSNPGSTTWNNAPTTFSIEVLNDVHGVLTVRYNSDPLSASPTRRYLGVDPTAHETSIDTIAFAWGSQWTGGQPLEPDVHWSELEQQVEGTGIWNTVYQGAAMSWKDGSLKYDSSGTINVLYRVRVKDTQGKYSSWSNVFYTRASAVTRIDDPPKALASQSARFMLDANFPNPFNPSTTISFTVADDSHVRLSVFNILGQEVRSLLNAPVSGGRHTIMWDGTDQTGFRASSGVYFCRLTAVPISSIRSGLQNPFSFVQKMLLAR